MKKERIIAGSILVLAGIGALKIISMINPGIIVIALIIMGMIYADSLNA